MILFALFCFAQVWSVRFGLHWFGRGCSATGRLVVVDLSPVLFALVCSGLVWSALLYDWSALVFLVSLFFYRLVWFKLVCPVCCARAGLVRQHDCDVKGSCLSQYVGRGQGSAAGTAEDHMTCLSFFSKVLGTTDLISLKLLPSW